MCGIAGYIRFGGLRPHETGMGRAMAELLSHRGPDDAGGYEDECASLGHARLSIIDPASGHQPICNENRDVWVVFNGEIYNHAQLADLLRDRGHILRTRSDTEILVHLYEDHGEDFLEPINGMFAIALWDRRRNRLVLARDRLGIKPLYWSYDGSRVLFASELKSILCVPDVRRQVDVQSLCDYLTFGYVPAPRTIFENIHKLEPGMLAVVNAPGLVTRRYWDIPIANCGSKDTTASRSAHDTQTGEQGRWVDRFADLLDEAVQDQLVADVPVGAFLSGGIDSAVVAAAMSRHAHGRVMTHSVGFESHEHDERTAARITAQRLHSDHRELLVRGNAAEALDQLVYSFDEPFADSSAIPMLYLSQVARSRVKVALSGDGADEMLAGYRRYRFDLYEDRLRDCLPGGLLRMAGWVGHVYPVGHRLPRHLRAKRTLQNIACDGATAHLRSVALMAGELPGLLLRADARRTLVDYDPFTRGRDLYARSAGAPALNRLLYVDMKTLLPDDMLTKVDRASMAAGLEVRVPLLDHRLVALAASLPVQLKLDGARGKVVLRQIASRWLGQDIAERPKRGFDVPIDGWFRGPLRDMACDVLGSGHSFMREWIEPSVAQRLLQQHLGGLRNYGCVLWTMLCLERWAQNYRQPCLDWGKSRRTDLHSPAQQGAMACAY